jgi:holliday junction DNA helicase RuvB
MITVWPSVCKGCNKVPTKMTSVINVDGNLYCHYCEHIKVQDLPKKVINWNEFISPTCFDTFIGQESIKNELVTMLLATKVHNIPIQHCLFSGSFGLGKTTLAKIFASYVGDYSLVVASNLSGKDDLPDTSIVIIDEIHTLSNEEWLLNVMDRGGQTILGATTTAGSLSGPLRSRFIGLTLQPYTSEELARMVKGAANNLKYDCPDFVANEVGKRGKTVARIALFLFKRIYDRITLNNYSISPEKLQDIFVEMRIDEDGLDNADRAYLSCLSDKPIGLQNIGAVTGFDRITIEETIEPYLLTRGFVKRTARGRILGDKKALGVWE